MRVHFPIPKRKRKEKRNVSVRHTDTEKVRRFQRRTDHCIFKTRPKHSQSYKLSPKQEEKGNDVRLEGEVGVEKARQEESFKDRGTCRKDQFFGNPNWVIPKKLFFFPQKIS